MKFIKLLLVLCFAVLSCAAYAEVQDGLIKSANCTEVHSSGSMTGAIAGGAGGSVIGGFLGSMIGGKTGAAIGAGVGGLAGGVAGEKALGSTSYQCVLGVLTPAGLKYFETYGRRRASGEHVTLYKTETGWVLQ